MKVVVIDSINDYGMRLGNRFFVESDITIDKVIKQIKDKEDWTNFYLEEGGFRAKIFEFGEVDIKFFDFVKEQFLDFNLSEDSYIYLIV